MTHSKSRFLQALSAASLLILAGTSALRAAPASDPAPSYDKETAQKLTGTYTGAFGKSKITVCVEKMVGSTVLGYSVVSGNERAFSGSFKDSDGVYEIAAREPGDDDSDGEFNFTINPDQHLTGTWKQFKKKRSVKFNLEKRDFKYDPTVGDYPQASTDLLEESDVENVASKDLRVMRNEIYARHGYSFKLEDMRKHFDAKDWYMPMSTEVSSQLTDIEEKNAALIKRYEDYGSKYYDNFGR